MIPGRATEKLGTKNVEKRPDEKAKCPSEVEQPRMVCSKLTLLFNLKAEFALRSTVLFYGPIQIFSVPFTASCHMF